jgi:hypothetical protein
MNRTKSPLRSKSPLRWSSNLEQVKIIPEPDPEPEPEPEVEEIPPPPPLPARASSPLPFKLKEKKELDPNRMIWKRNRKKTKEVIESASVVGKQNTAVYAPFGTMCIHLYNLEYRSILSIKRKNLCSSIVGVPNRPISTELRDYILEFMKSGKMDWKSYGTIDNDEKMWFEMILQKVHMPEVLEGKYTKTKKVLEEEQLFEKYKQRYIDGETDAEFLLAFRRLIVKFISESRIPQKTGITLLLNVSTA